MAARRTRIKGILNIPQRKKAPQANDATRPENLEQENNNLTLPQAEKVEKSELNPEIEKPKLPCSDKEIKTNEFINNPPTQKEVITPILEKKPDTPFKRKFLKPTVSLNAINRKPKQVEVDKNDLKNADNVAIKADISPKLNVVYPPKQNFIAIPTHLEINVTDNVEVNLNETCISHQHTAQSVDGIKRLPTGQTEVEYPPLPPSPNKVNRSRIKAIPRLSQRKTSVSASESEDESRRHYNRHRNDSVCSTVSGTTDLTPDVAQQKPKEFNSVIQKKCRRTEQSRKLAEARRDFYLRFNNKKPDRQKLTMIDLIFYNPTTNPMTYEGKLKKSDSTVESSPLEAAEETIDDPQPEPEPEPAKENKSDEENEMPVPQIKVGPNGEIMIDEQSLVIENKETIKNREELAKSKVVDGDFDTGYGIYKRAKRSKDWSHSETLRFYKALNTIGTDFTLMCDLFPKRSRRELKQKFKKEERVNHTLIDKAVMQPTSFDYSELKEEVDIEEKELALLEQQKEESKKLGKEKSATVRKRKLKDPENADKDKICKKSLKKEELEKQEEKRDENEANDKESDKKTNKKDKERKPRAAKRKRIVKPVDSPSESDEDDESDSSVIKAFVSKPTRSGRIPKTRKELAVKKLIGIESEIKDFDRKPMRSGRKPKTRNEQTTPVKKLIGDEPEKEVAPGSLMVVPTEAEDGKIEYKIYMVTPDQNATPLTLNSDAVSKVMGYKQNAINAENILTISAERRKSLPELEDAPRRRKSVNLTIPAGEELAIPQRRISVNITIPASDNNPERTDSVNPYKHDDIQSLEKSVLQRVNLTVPSDEPERRKSVNLTIPAEESLHGTDQESDSINLINSDTDINKPKGNENDNLTSSVENPHSLSSHAPSKEQNIFKKGSLSNLVAEILEPELENENEQLKNEPDYGRIDLIQDTNESKIQESGLEESVDSENLAQIPMKETENSVLPVENLLGNEKEKSVAPGSIMVVPTEGPDGKMEYKVYIVNQDKKATLLDLDNDMLSKVIDLKLKSNNAQNISSTCDNDLSGKEMNKNEP